MRLSLRNRFLIPTLVLIFVCMGTATLVSFLNTKQALEEAVAGQIQQQAASIANQVAAWVKERRFNVRQWSQDPMMRWATVVATDKDILADTNKHLDHLKNETPYYEMIMVTNPQGLATASSDPSVVGKTSIADRQYFKGAMQGKLAVSEAYKSPTSGHPVVTIAGPVMDKDVIEGVLMAVVDVSLLAAEVVDPVTVGQGGYAFLTNKEGLTLAHPDKTKVLSLDLSKLDFGQRMLAAKQGMLSYSFEGVEKMAAFRQEKELGWLVVVTANHGDLMAPARRLGYLNVLIALAALALAGLVM
ncbi:MAG: cache domain-containing protein, partial [Desulfarculus sp.]|nr:cache domain-containing protein [Desulfarculus sp.]